VPSDLIERYDHRRLVLSVRRQCRRQRFLVRDGARLEAPPRGEHADGARQDQHVDQSTEHGRGNPRAREQPVEPDRFLSERVDRLPFLRLQAVATQVRARAELELILADDLDRPIDQVVAHRRTRGHQRQRHWVDATDRDVRAVAHQVDAGDVLEAAVDASAQRQQPLRQRKPLPLGATGHGDPGSEANRGERLVDSIVHQERSLPPLIE
jgi:hypothetical protein